MKLTGTAPRSAARRALPVAPRVGAAAALAVLLVGCWSAQAEQASKAEPRPVTSVVEHWGSFFGGRKGNFGTQMLGLSYRCGGHASGGYAEEKAVAPVVSTPAFSPVRPVSNPALSVPYEPL